jgi:adenylate cyclase
MSEDKVFRKIAVIFVTDVVNFSTLMESNEELTLKNLKACRQILDNLFKEHSGRIFNTAGDSVLAEFHSAVSSVICASEFQKLISQRNESVSPLEQLTFRIGINMGDVVVEGSNLYGEGVNVAARLEALCKPGGVCLSNNVHDFVKQKVELSFLDLGSQQVKNTIVRAFEVAGSDGAAVSAPSVSANNEQETEASKPPTIAVLPFLNLSNDPEQDYFADGISEDIISNLSSWRTFPVISRNSSFSYRSTEKKSSEIAAELDARYMVEGSVRKGGNKVRVTVSLLDAVEDKQIWSQRWDRLLDDIFEVQDEISQSVASIIAPALKTEEQKRLSSKKTSNFSAWDLYLKALGVYNDRELFQAFTDERQGGDMVLEFCDKAIEMDPEFCDPFVLKCRVLFGRIFSHEYRDERKQNEKEFHNYSQKAYELDGSNPEALVMYSRSFNIKKDLTKRNEYAKKALEANPSHPDTNYDYGLSLCNDREFEEALVYVNKAIEMDPANKDRFEGFLPLLFMAMRDLENSLKWLLLMNERGAHSRYLGWLACTYAHLDEMEKAGEHLEKFLKERPEIKTLTNYRTVAPTIAEEFLIEGLRKAGMPD